jgi:signal transduction histidine kinase
MTPARSRVLAKTLFTIFVALLVAEVALEVAARTGPRPPTSSLLGDLGFTITFALFPIVGLILALRRPENALGWLMLAMGVILAVPTEAYGVFAYSRGWSGAEWAIASTQWTWVPEIGLAGTFVLMLFPDGHLPSPRWRWVAWTVGIGIVVSSVAVLFGPGSLADNGYPQLRNPFGIEALKPFLAVAVVSIATIPLGIIAAAVSLVVRYRRGDPTERLQIRWLTAAAIVVAALYAAAMIATTAQNASWAGGGSGWISALQNLAVVSFALVPIAIGFAVLKYRLYDIDLVIRKAVVVGAIAVFFTAVYAAIVGGIGALVQTHATTQLSFVAAAVMALLFQPVLARARRIADRVVYGKRATPYEVLSEFSDRLGGTYAADDVLPRMARIVAEGVGAARADVWLLVGDRLRVAASWPSDVERSTAVALSDGALPALPHADEAFSVEQRGEILGALAVAMPANDPLDDAKRKLVSDLAGQAGLVLRNVRLTEDLRARLEDLQAAQKRLVAAQDAERRRLERNIHDGAQQQLVALSVKLRLTQSLVGPDPEKAEAMLTELQTQTTETLEDLRDLARGIYPPLLADQGLPAALEAQARKSALQIDIAPGGVGRFPQEMEAAVYFSVLEALQNVAKYAGASHAEVRLAAADGRLRFEVRDDGNGFDPSQTRYGTGLQGIADRLGALEGSLDVRSEPGLGTTVAGEIPVDTMPGTERGDAADVGTPATNGDLTRKPEAVG